MLSIAVPYIRKLLPQDKQMDNALFHSTIANNTMSHIDKTTRFHAFCTFLLAVHCKIAVPPPITTSPDQPFHHESDQQQQAQRDNETADNTAANSQTPRVTFEEQNQMEHQLTAASDHLAALRAQTIEVRLKRIREETARVTAELKGAFDSPDQDIDARLSGTDDVIITEPSKQQKRKQNDDDRKTENESLLRRIATLEKQLTEGSSSHQLDNARNVYGMYDSPNTHTRSLFPPVVFPKITVGDHGVKPSEFHGSICPPQVIEKLKSKAHITLRAVLAYLERRSVNDTFYFDTNENNETVQKTRTTSSTKFTAENQLHLVLLALVEGFKHVDTALGDYLSRAWPVSFLHLQRSYPANISMQEEYLERQFQHIRHCLHQGITVSATYDHGLAHQLSAKFSSGLTGFMMRAFPFLSLPISLGIVSTMFCVATRRSASLL